MNLKLKSKKTKQPPSVQLLYGAAVPQLHQIRQNQYITEWQINAESDAKLMLILITCINYLL